MSSSFALILKFLTATEGFFSSCKQDGRIAAPAERIRRVLILDRLSISFFNRRRKVIENIHFSICESDFIQFYFFRYYEIKQPPFIKKAVEVGPELSVNFFLANNNSKADGL